MTKLIRMKREGDNPCAADVHPDEVENYRAGGFDVADDQGDPLDHDGDGASGGSVKGFHATAAKGARKRKARK